MSNGFLTAPVYSIGWDHSFTTSAKNFYSWQLADDKIVHFESTSIPEYMHGPQGSADSQSEEYGYQVMAVLLCIVIVTHTLAIFCLAHLCMPN